MVAAFITAHRDRFGVAPICRVLTQHGVPIAPETYYAHLRRPVCRRSRRDVVVLAAIRAVHTASVRRYGARKVYHQLLRDGGVDGVAVARCTVERLMAEHGLAGVSRNRRVRTTVRDDHAHRPADLVKRDFTATRPNQLWVVDFTYVATLAGFVYVAFAVDVFSRMIVGWRAAKTMSTELPLDALDMALWHRGRAGHDVTGVIHHSDAGSQYTAMRYTTRLSDAGALASIGTIGDSFDNALAETVNGLYKAELVYHQGPWKNADDLELATLVWVDWFNNTRLHSALAYRTPAEAETEYYRHNTPTQRPLAGQPAL